MYPLIDCDLCMDAILKMSNCIIREYFGIYCPGCGATRAIYFLYHFQIVSSILANPIVVMVIVDLLLFCGLNVYEIYNGRVCGIRSKIVIITIILWMIFAIGRDILYLFMGYDYLGDFN